MRSDWKVGGPRIAVMGVLVRIEESGHRQRLDLCPEGIRREQGLRQRLWKQLSGACTSAFRVLNGRCLQVTLPGVWPLLLSPLSPQEMGTWPWGPSPLLRQTDRQTAGSLLDGAQGALPCGGAQGTWYSPRVRDGFLWFFPESRPAPSQPHPFVSAAPFTGRPSTDPRSVTLAHHMPVPTPPSLRSFLEQGARRDLSSCLQRSALCLGPRTVATSP